MTDSVPLIRVSDDLDEGNADASGNPLPDNRPDATHGHRIDYDGNVPWDWGYDLAGMWLYTLSTEYDPNTPETYSLSFPSTVKVWRASETPNNGPAWGLCNRTRGEQEVRPYGARGFAGGRPSAQPRQKECGCRGGENVGARARLTAPARAVRLRRARGA